MENPKKLVIHDRSIDHGHHDHHCTVFHVLCITNCRLTTTSPPQCKSESFFSSPAPATPSGCRTTTQWQRPPRGISRPRGRGGLAGKWRPAPGLAVVTRVCSHHVGQGHTGVAHSDAPEGGIGLPHVSRTHLSLTPVLTPGVGDCFLLMKMSDWVWGRSSPVGYPSPCAFVPRPWSIDHPPGHRQYFIGEGTPLPCLVPLGDCSFFAPHWPLDKGAPTTRRLDRNIGTAILYLEGPTDRLAHRPLPFFLGTGFFFYKKVHKKVPRDGADA